MSWNLSEEKIQEVWENLQRRETFTKGQIPPYRVEFDAPSQEGPFEPGELNIHHGPFLSAHGTIGEITDSYRGLNYFFGAYVLSFRWIRPQKLEFFRDGTKLTVKLHSYVRPWMLPFYKTGLYVFWRFFGVTFLF